MPKYNFEAKQLRTIKSPSDERVTTYTALVNFKNLPSGISLEVNPRKPKMNTAVARKLISAVKGVETDFDIKNRGIVIIAKEVKFDNATHTLKLDLGDDPKKYGILDGGHTYTAIIENREEIPEDSGDKFVKLEILVGDTLDAAGLADARNTSVQVSDIALFELDNKFGIVKSALKGESYANDIAYKDNDDKSIAIADILRLMFTFNIERFKVGGTDVPTSAYSSKASVFKDYQKMYNKKPNVYEATAKHLPELIALYEKIEEELPDKYKEFKSMANQGASLGRVRGIEGSGDFRSDFSQRKINYQISSGFLLPIFGAFRALVHVDDENTEDWSWEFNPMEVWSKVGTSLVQNTFDTETNPQMAGKSKTLWQANYRIVDGLRKDMLIAKMEKQMHNS